MPPRAPHPQINDCVRCHSGVVAQDNASIVDRLRHVDGNIDVNLDESCTACHGSVNAAPPKDLSGVTSTSSRGVGAHQIHLSGTQTAKAVACSACHQVPTALMTPGHVDTALPAELVFSGAAVDTGATPTYFAGACTNTACHAVKLSNGSSAGGTLTAPAWTVVDGTQAACGSCHALPPPRPHPYFSEDCGRCHENMSPDGKAFVRPELHVDGNVTFTVP
jgi:predicted CxxxxCH...CXXCH cytochrome family protein